MKYILKYSDIKKKYYYKKNELLKTELKTPYLTNLNKETFNEFYDRKMAEEQKEIEGYYSDAREDYDSSIKEDYPFHVHEYVYIGNTGLNKDYLISLYFEYYLYMGGAHGDEGMESNTWDMKLDRTIKLSELFVEGYDYKDNIVNIIRKQVSMESDSNYFDGINDNLAKYFDENNYYLTDKYLVIYYQKYTIAPGAGGVLQFYVKYSDLEINERYKKILQS